MAKVLQIRLSDFEASRIEALAKKSGKPNSTLARDLLLRAIDRIDIERNRGTAA